MVFVEGPEVVLEHYSVTSPSHHAVACGYGLEAKIWLCLDLR